ncbi:permease for cytosine/purines, uracil, thiamine, allantoin-domain-containing protein [Lasiosphaeria miniovina]|uniref:Permease for cytosine/purines, uracil, thiamine, allantoin-domain-containing protein n=1 Tax=Lasiosphaeria miniovina TaxID=1954250 RepID=A0AA40DW86_9PEZI|nr:permease for cytosine/purines, uracil, thiamine, allantoin-domain-containing protein [Lasiosphaeria miniovina]KAK0718654.1 permease for cytosine/purines, uracil, thiamine, allantoin-domain-containing protein [Lasiosphaeria miniovina]
MSTTTADMQPAADDAEKGSAQPVQAADSVSGSVTSLLRRLNDRIEGLAGFEARGIARVEPEERQAPSLAADLQIAILWFSANISANNLTTGLFGPLVFQLGFADSAVCAVVGGLLGSASTGYMAVWGPQSGHRTMVVLRYLMGYWPSKLPCLLNIVLMVGYTTLNLIISGQILSAVSDGAMSIVVGIVVVAIVNWVVAVFGMYLFHYYERYAWLPQLLVLSVLIGCAGSHFDASLESTGDGATLAANRLSFLSLCLYVPNSWGAAASDYYVYYPEKTSKLKIFLLTLAGLWVSFTLVYMIGIGLASGIPTNQAWADAYAVSVGALIVEGFRGLSGFGGFCGVVVALGVIANSIPGTYSAALGFQVLGRYGKAAPRWLWCCVIVVVMLVCALAGRDHLMVVFQNFLALMGYWVEFMVLIVLLESLLFRRGAKTFDWTRCEDKTYLPIGLAALAAFLLGWVGAILGMYQVWFTGPLAQLAGYSDIGIWVGCAFTLVSYPPLRWLELKMIGR